MMLWLSQHPAWSKARKVAISTSAFGLESPVDFYGNVKPSAQKIRFVAAYDYVFSFWHKRRYIKVVKTKAEGLVYHPMRSLEFR